MNDSWILMHGWSVFKCSTVSFSICIFLIAVCKSSNFNPNIWHIPRNIIQFFIYLKNGRRFVARIDNTWRTVKGSVSKNGFLHTDRVFPEGMTFCLGEDEFHKVKVTDSDEEVYDKIINLNIRDLKMVHPLKDKFRPRGRAQDPFAEPRPQRQVFDEFEDAFDELPPQMRSRLVAQLYSYDE